MALSLTKLQDELFERLFAAPSADLDASVEGWAEAYGAFVVDARGCGTAPAPGSIDAAKGRLKDVLKPGLAVSTGIPATATAFEGAFIAFWTGFAFTGTVVAVPGTPTLANALTALWDANPLLLDARLAADLHGALLRTWSLTVVCGLPCNAAIV